MTEALGHALDDLVIANRILRSEGVVDAYCQISVRHPENPSRYFSSDRFRQTSSRVTT